MFTRRAFVKLASLVTTLGVAVAAQAKKKKSVKITGRILEGDASAFLLADGDYDHYGDEWDVFVTEKTKFFTKKKGKKRKRTATSDIIEEFAKVTVIGKKDKDIEFTMTAKSVTRILPDYDYYY